VLVSYAVGAHPYFALDHGRPTSFPESAIHAWRVSRDPRYAHFFVRPAENGAVVGLTF
jgi:hypothetical protein